MTKIQSIRQVCFNPMRNSFTKKLLPKSKNSQLQNHNPNLKDSVQSKRRESLNMQCWDQQSRLLDLLREQDQRAYKKKKEKLIKLNAEKGLKKNQDGGFENVLERMKYCQQKTWEKKKIMISQFEKEEYKECTFTPTVRKKENTGTTSNTLAIAGTTSNSGATFITNHPSQEHSTSEILTDKHCDQSCLSRASSVIKHNSPDSEELLRKESSRHRNCQSFHEIRRNSDLKFHPDILQVSKNIKRQQSIDQILSKDAKRRQLMLSQNNSFSHSPRPSFTSPQSHLSFLSKFSKQFQACLDSLDHTLHTHLLPGECFLNFDEFKIIMEGLKYIRIFNSLSTEDVAKLGDMWEVMGGCEFGGVSKEKLKRALLAVEGVGEDGQLLKSAGKRKREVKFGSMNWQQSVDLNCFKHQFKNFNTNKKSNAELGQAKGEEYSFKPQILKCSARLAQKHRKRFFDNQQGAKKKRQSNDEHSLTNFFELHQKQIQRKNSLKKNIKVQEQIKKCTFKPQINTHSRKSSKHVISKSQLNPSKDSVDPIFSMQVNLKDQKIDQIFIFQNDTPQTVIATLKQRYTLTSAQQTNFLKIITENLSRISRQF